MKNATAKDDVTFCPVDKFELNRENNFPNA
jgi:hypothetical protein